MRLIPTHTPMPGTLADPILPIFAILGVGFFLHRKGLFDVGTAKAINKFVFFVATPALLFSILSRASIESINAYTLALYFLSQCVIYLCVAVLLYRRFKVALKESILLGMTACFVNHVFFVLPIAERIYGTQAAQPIASIILLDAVIMFCGTVLVMDVLSERNKSVGNTLVNLAKNPFLLACALGVSVWFVPSLVPSGLITYANFVGNAAAPASLFALGIILASKPIRPIGSVTWIVIISKIALHPALYFMLAGVAGIASHAADISLLVAAGPCGAMPFVIALQYGVNPNAIAKAILIATGISLFSLAALTA